VQGKQRIRIRKAVQGDAPVLAELMNAAGEGIPAYLWSGMAPSGGDVMAFGAARVAREQGDFSYRNMYVAEIDGQVAGMLLSYQLPDPYVLDQLESYPALVRPLVRLEALAAGSWYINAIATGESWRGVGIGTRLMALGQVLAMQARVATLSLIVSEHNAGAMNLYTRLNFAPAARQPVMPAPGLPSEGDWVLMTRRAP
jgi:ribosomal protein S18 acetylase RimI-like enzyme